MSEKESAKEVKKEEKEDIWFTFGNIRLVISKEVEEWTNIAVFFQDDDIRETKIGKRVQFGIMDRHLPQFLEALAGPSTAPEKPIETISEADKKILELGKKIIELIKSSAVLK
ncbi:MAG: hypothetical protein ACFFCD_05430 [Promethearchaeota archaeon]